MKQRIITGALCAILLLPILFFYNTLVFNLVIAVISAVSVFEVLQAAGLHKNPAFLAVCILFAAGVPFVNFSYFSFLSFFFTALIFVVLIFSKNSLHFEKVGTVFPMLLIVPFGMAATVYLRDFNEHGLLYLFLAIQKTRCFTAGPLSYRSINWIRRGPWCVIHIIGIKQMSILKR